MKTSKYLKMGLLTASLAGGSTALALGSISDSDTITLNANVGAFAEIDIMDASKNFGTLYDGMAAPALQQSNACLYSNTLALNISAHGTHDDPSNINKKFMLRDGAEDQIGENLIAYYLAIAPGNSSNYIQIDANGTFLDQTYLAGQPCSMVDDPTAVIQITAALPNTGSYHRFGDYSDVLTLAVTPNIDDGSGGIGGGPGGGV